MRNRNTMGRFEFIFDHMGWAVITLIYYRSFLFNPITGLDYKKSLYCLFGLIFLFMAAGTLMTVRRRRNRVSLFTNTVYAFGVYFVLSFWNVIPVRLICTVVLAGVLAAAYIGMVLTNYIRDRKAHRTGASWRQCISGCLLSSRTLVAGVLAVLILSLAARPLLGLPIMEVGNNPVQEESSASSHQGATITKHMDTVLLLQEELWAELDGSERLDVMKTLADIEANYLGIPEMEVGVRVMNATTLAHYEFETETIVINLSHLTSTDSRSAVETLCHECRHAYQHRLVQAYSALGEEYRRLRIFDEVSDYKEEFANYIDGDDDFEGYYRQQCETDSRNYAVEAADEYFMRIAEYHHSLQQEEDAS